MTWSYLNIRRALGRRKRNLLRGPDARWGVNFISEIPRRLGHAPQVILDVGAHIGMTALELSDAFPEAVVHAFEPGSRNFARLKANLSGKPEIQLHQLAIGAASGSANLLIEPEHPSMARIGEGDGPSETVEVTTLDQFCGDNGIGHVDVMKVDTEGHEFEVLEGARELISEGRIDLIKLECGVNPDFDYHADLAEVMTYLQERGYRLFGIYDQWECTLNPSAALRRADAAFVSRRAVEKARAVAR